MSLRVLSIVFGLLGFVLLIGGIALVNVPAALCVAGVLLMMYARLIDRASAALEHRGNIKGKG